MDDRWALLLFLPCQENDPKDEEDDGEDSAERSGSLVVLRDRGQGVIHLGTLVLLVLEPNGIIPILIEIMLVIRGGGLGLDHGLVPGNAVLQDDSNGSSGIVGEADLRFLLGREIVIMNGPLVVPGREIGMPVLVVLAVFWFEGDEEHETDDSDCNEKGPKESAHVQPPSL